MWVMSIAALCVSVLAIKRPTIFLLASAAFLNGMAAYLFIVR